MFDLIINSIGSLVEPLFEAIGLFLNKKFMEGCEKILQYSITTTGNFWDNPNVVGLIGLAQWVCSAIMMCAALVSILDILEDRAANKQVYVSAIVSNFAKALAFSVAAPYLAKYSLMVCDLLTQAMNLSELVTSVTFNAQINSFLLIIMLIAVIVFLYQSLKRFGTMLIQICTCPLYVVGIVRGDTSAMGSWLRQTIAIALTFLFQYFLFTFGILFWIESSWLLCFSCWISMGAIVRVLDKYGMSTGSGGLGSAASMAMQGVSMLAR